MLLKIKYLGGWGIMKPDEIKSEEYFKAAAARMEDALASALNAVTSKPNVTPDEIAKVLKLIIKKEMILEFLLDDVQDHHHHK